MKEQLRKRFDGGLPRTEEEATQESSLLTALPKEEEDEEEPCFFPTLPHPTRAAYHALPVAAVVAFMLLVLMHLLHLDQTQLDQKDATITQLKSLVRSAQNELVYMRKSKEWEESDAMASMQKRVAKAERDTQAFKQETQQLRAELAKLKKQMQARQPEGGERKLQSKGEFHDHPI